MNLTFSTKLCIVACHSDTPFKKNIIHHNDPLLKKIAHTIYINSSKYGKTIPMIHTNKLDKYDKKVCVPYYEFKPTKMYIT